jgi:hypothetical protein
MKRLALLVLACLAPSCGATSTVVFTGQNVSHASRKFGVFGRPAEDRIIVMEVARGIGIRLPYAEDWEFEPTDQKPIFGRSGSLLMFVTVQAFDPGKQVEEESYLRDEFLKNIRAGNERRGTPIADAVVHKQGDHFVLEYVGEGTLPNGVKFKQNHFWTFRQRADGLLYEAHLSTNNPREAERMALCEKIRKILGGEFHITPTDGK